MLWRCCARCRHCALSRHGSPRPRRRAVLGIDKQQACSGAMGIPDASKNRGTKTPKTFPSPCTNTAMPRPTPRSILKWRSDGSRTFAQVRRKVSIAYNMGHSIFASKITPFRGPIPKPKYLPLPLARPTYHAKRHADPIRRFSTMHWTDPQTNRQMTRKAVSYTHLTLPTNREV